MYPYNYIIYLQSMQFGEGVSKMFLWLLFFCEYWNGILIVYQLSKHQRKTTLKNVHRDIRNYIRITFK